MGLREQGSQEKSQTQADLSTILWQKVILFFALAGAIFWGVIRAGFGTQDFSYTLDDPYIHLRLAEQIAHGHYGINASEFSSPSSSILWPFLLAPLARTPVGAYFPLLINAICACALAALGFKAFHGKWALAKVLALLILTNTVGLVFTGMEHNLQILLAVACAYGVVLLAIRDECPTWFPIVLVLGPLIRYENLFLSLPIIGLVLFWKRRKQALAAIALLVLLVGGFSLFLHFLGLGLLPNSVVAKSGGTQHSLQSVFWQTPLASIRDNWRLMLFQASLVLCSFLGFGKTRSLGAVALLALWLHITFGRYGWWDRYECYLNGFLLALAFQSTTKILRWPVKAPAFTAAVLLAIRVSANPFGVYTFRFKSIPTDSRAIAVQQLQMHRFAVDYWKHPVAVNDLGWVSWRNPNFVLDLYGLGNSEALKDRLTHPNTDWMEPLCKRHDVELVMLYESWFHHLPKSWIRVGQLMRAGGDDRTVVSIFVTHPETVREAVADLHRFGPTIPSDAELKVER